MKYTDEWACDLLGIPRSELSIDEFSDHQKERIALVLKGARAAQAAAQPAAAEPATDDEALAFHHAITDGAIGQSDLDEIKIGLNAVLLGRSEQALAAPAQAAAVPEAVPDERERMRADQAAAVMPQIGPLLDAWEGISNDVKGAITIEAPGLVRHLKSINRSMEGDDRLAAPEARKAGASDKGETTNDE
jgi:hypothetical protein